MPTLLQAVADGAAKYRNTAELSQYRAQSRVAKIFFVGDKGDRHIETRDQRHLVKPGRVIGDDDRVAAISEVLLTDHIDLDAESPHGTASSPLQPLSKP